TPRTVFSLKYAPGDRNSAWCWVSAGFWPGSTRSGRSRSIETPSKAVSNVFRDTPARLASGHRSAASHCWNCAFNDWAQACPVSRAVSEIRAAIAEENRGIVPPDGTYNAMQVEY